MPGVRQGNCQDPTSLVIDHYFSLLARELRTSHIELGELFLEFLKCDKAFCQVCSDILGMALNSIPEPDILTGHYKTYVNTTTVGRATDD